MPCEPPAVRAHDGEVGAERVVRAELDVVVVAEGELVQIVLEVLLAAVVIDAFMRRLSTQNKPSMVFTVTLLRTSSQAARHTRSCSENLPPTNL